MYKDDLLDLFNNLPHLVVEVKDEKIISANPEAKKKLVTKLPMDLQFYENTEEGIVRLTLENLTEDAHFHFIDAETGGNEMLFQVQKRWSGRHGNTWLILEDRTFQKATDLEVKDIEDKFVKLLNQVPHPLYIKNNKGKYKFANTAQARLLKAVPDEMVGKTDKHFFPVSDDVTSILESDKEVIAKLQRQVIPSQTLTLQDGTTRILHTTKTPFINESDGKVDILGVSIDITETQRLKGELLDKNTELDSFLYRTSHDLVSPLTSLSGVFNLLKREFDNDQITHLYDHAEICVNRLRKIITDISYYADNNRSPLKTEMVNFKSLYEHCLKSIEPYTVHHNFVVTLDLDQKEGFLSDQNRIMIVMVNLITNAAIFSDHTRDNQKITVTIRANKDEMSMTVSDNGIGIPKELSSRIFDMFFRGSEQSAGAGLGLYVCRKIVSKMNGSIHVNSKQSVGSSVTVTLPSAKPRHPGINLTKEEIHN